MAQNISTLFFTLLLLTIVQLTTTSSSLHKMREDCEQMSRTSDCRCMRRFDFEITCFRWGIDPYFTVRKRQNNHLQIDCHRIDPYEFSALVLPRINIGSKAMVEVRQCPLPSLQLIQNITQRFGITQVNALIFESGKFGGSLTRQHFQGLHDLRQLGLTSNGLSALPEDVFVDLKNLTRLDLRRNSLEELPEKIFSSLENLNYLELSHNNLQDVPPGIFRNQKKLIRLDLSSNNLTNLNRAAFEGMSSINELDLSSNKILTLPRDVFTFLINLTNINLDGNYFQSLPVGLFAENKDLSFFRLNNNRVPLKQLPAGLLSNLLNLREVRLSCGLETIPPDVFAKSTAIRHITITGNALTELPRLLFVDQMELINLDLTKNQLVTLPDDIFEKTRNLIVLRLSHNKLENVTSDIFTALANLEVLYMDNNNLHSINPAAFTYNQKLTDINMENNHISLHDSFHGNQEPYYQYEIKSPFEEMRELKTLNLRNNSIRNIFGNWMLNNLKLTALDLSYNDIIMVTANDLQYVSSDISVNLTHNTISTIKLQKGNYLALNKKNQIVKVAIGHNPLYCDCELLHFLEFLNGTVDDQLKDVLKVSADDLQCNAPEHLKGRSVAQLSPKDLLCSYDYEDCPNGCSCWSRKFDGMLIVNCSNREFTKIPQLPTLKPIHFNGTVLYMENNRLKELPLATTLGYANVIQLYVANNSLTTISVDNLPKLLDYFDVSYNKLQGFHNNMLKVFNESRNKLALSHNPLACDCTSQSLSQFIQASGELIQDLKEMECVSGEKFQKLSPEAMCPIKHGLVIAVSVIISMIGICLGVLSALYYKYQQEIKVWLYAHNTCLWFVTEEELDKDKKYDAFISYSHKDEDLITDYLVPELENGPTPFKLCLHIRDWVVGEFIPNQIVQSVDDSRRTIIILSPNFIESIWARMEFRAAHTAALNEGRTRVIVIIYGDIGNIDNLDPELKAYLQMNTYMQWGDPWFWDKLRYAMPHPSNNRSRHVNTALQTSADCKLDLTKLPPIIPHITTPPAQEASKNPLMAQYLC